MYSRTGILSRRQLSTTERIAATRGPACWLPMWIQFFLLCEDLHNRNYVQFPIMRSVRDVCLLYLLAPTKRCA